MLLLVLTVCTLVVGSDGSGSDNTGAIVGGVVGGIAAIVVIIVIIIMVYIFVIRPKGIAITIFDSSLSFIVVCFY